MSNENMNQPKVNDQHRKCGSGRRFLAGVLTGTLLGSLVVGSISLYSYSKAAPPWAAFSGERRLGFHRHGIADPEIAGERADFVTEWLLKRVNASDEQRQKIKSIVQSTVKDLFQLKEQHEQNRQAMLNALLQPAINREALKQSRQAELQLIDAVSSRLVDSIADVADTLTLEQRSQLAEYVSRMHR